MDRRSYRKDIIRTFDRTDPYRTDAENRQGSQTPPLSPITDVSVSSGARGDSEGKFRQWLC